MVPDSVVKKIESGTIYFSYASCFTVSSPGKAQRISALKRSASVSIWKLPPWRPTKLFTIARPRPEPSVLRDSSPRTKRSVISSGNKSLCGNRKDGERCIYPPEKYFRNRAHLQSGSAYFTMLFRRFSKIR